MQEQLLTSVRHLQNQLDAGLQAVDKLMATKAAQLKVLEQEIDRKYATLRGLQGSTDDGV
jgi:hypothetical protein